VAAIVGFDRQDRHSAQVVGPDEPPNRVHPAADELVRGLELPPALLALVVSHHQLHLRRQVDLVAIGERGGQDRLRLGGNGIRERLRRGTVDRNQHHQAQHRGGGLEPDPRDPHQIRPAMPATEPLLAYPDPDSASA
jgi:hypothetical protein